MTSKLRKAVQQQKKQTKKPEKPITGILGIPINGQRRVEVQGRNGFVYVRLRNNENEVIQAFNNQVSPAYNLPVLVERQGTRYIVTSVDTQRYNNNWDSYSAFVPRHGGQHSFDVENGGGGDIVWVHGRQFMPLLTIPSGSVGANNVLLTSYTLRNQDGSWKFVGNTGTQNLSPYNPATGSQAVMGIVYLDTVSGNPGFVLNSGTYFPNTITGSAQIVPYLPAITNPNWIPDSAIRLITGTSKITWDNIYDVRQFPQKSNFLEFQDDGVSLGFAHTVDFGDNVSVSISGTVARVYVTGSSGGGSFDNFWTSGSAGAGSLRTKELNSDAVGDYSFAVGFGNYASGSYSHAEGRNTTAIGAKAHSEGDGTLAFGDSSHAEGASTKAYGFSSHAEGFTSIASGSNSFSQGFRNESIAPSSATLGGQNNRVSGNNSVILGGSGTNGIFNSTVFVPNLNIRFVQSGTAITNIGVDINGNIVSGSAGGGGGDSTYLRLDTTNNPLTGKLQVQPVFTEFSPTPYGIEILIDPSTQQGVGGMSIVNPVGHGMYVESDDGKTLADFEQYGQSGTVVNSALLFAYRSPYDASNVSFTEPMIELAQDRSNGSISGELLTFTSDNVERVSLNPSAQGTGTYIKFDGDFALSPNGNLLSLFTSGSSRFYVNASGTAHSNGVPLIKEAPTDGVTYGRNNAGWVVVSGSSSSALNIQDEGSALGTATTLNFVGSPVSVTISGSVARVFVTGSSSGALVQSVYSGYSSADTTNVSIPNDNTIPQNTEGKEFMSATITPQNANNSIEIQVVLYGAASAAAVITVAIFRDDTADAIAATTQQVSVTNGRSTINTFVRVTAGSTSATTFKVRAGLGGAGTLTFNGAAGNREYGTANKSAIVLREYSG